MSFLNTIKVFFTYAIVTQILFQLKFRLGKMTNIFRDENHEKYFPMTAFFQMKTKVKEHARH